MQSAQKYWSDRMEFKTNFMEAGVSATLPSDLPKQSFFSNELLFCKEKIQKFSFKDDVYSE